MSPLSERYYWLTTNIGARVSCLSLLGTDPLKNRLNSDRSDAPMTRISCASLSAAIVETTSSLRTRVVSTGLAVTLSVYASSRLPAPSLWSSVASAETTVNSVIDAAHSEAMLLANVTAASLLGPPATGTRTELIDRFVPGPYWLIVTSARASESARPNSSRMIASLVYQLVA